MISFMGTELTFRGWQGGNSICLIKKSLFQVFSHFFEKVIIVVAFVTLVVLRLNFLFLYKFLMWERNQKTLNSEVSFSGIGLHSGTKVDVNSITSKF